VSERVTSFGERVFDWVELEDRPGKGGIRLLLVSSTMLGISTSLLMAAYEWWPLGAIPLAVLVVWAVVWAVLP
jgi:hypothetical protein